MQQVNAIKIGDGDLVIINHCSNYDYKAAKLADKIRKWLSSRNIEAVDVVLNDCAPANSGITMTVLTVNNIFEQEVLNNGRQ